jgi:hypothetical protein
MEVSFQDTEYESSFQGTESEASFFLFQSFPSCYALRIGLTPAVIKAASVAFAVIKFVEDRAI